MAMLAMAMPWHVVSAGMLFASSSFGNAILTLLTCHGRSCVAVSDNPTTV